MISSEAAPDIRICYTILAALVRVPLRLLSARGRCSPTGFKSVGCIFCAWHEPRAKKREEWIQHLVSALPTPLLLLPAYTLLQANIARVANDHVVKQFDLKQLADLDQLFGDLQVFKAGYRAAAGVEMCMFVLCMFVVT